MSYGRKKLMSEEICECGHSKSEHLDFMWVKPEKEGEPTYQRWVAKGLGMCSKCACAEFKKKD